jgi:uncharacterized membrane protein YiaA
MEIPMTDDTPDKRIESSLQSIGFFLLVIMFAAMTSCARLGVIRDQNEQILEQLTTTN